MHHGYFPLVHIAVLLSGIHCTLDLIISVVFVTSLYISFRLQMRNLAELTDPMACTMFEGKKYATVTDKHGQNVRTCLNM